MKAVTITGFGGPDCISLQEAPDPVAAPGEIVIEVHYSGVNFAEILTRQGRMPIAQPPIVMGLEVVGTVHALGDGVEGFALGQAVAAFARSGHAEYVAVPAAFAVPLDIAGRTLPMVEAVALPCAGVTAHQLLTTMGHLEPGETVFVQGASSGVGTIVAATAKRLGAGRILGSVSSEAKADFARDHGYDDLLVGEGRVSELAEFVGPGGVDLLLEGVAGDNIPAALPALAPLGRAVYFGDANFMSPAQVALQMLRGGSWMVAGYSLGSLNMRAPGLWRPSAEAMLQLIGQGLSLGPVQIFDPAEASHVHDLIEKRQVVGKLAFAWRP